MSDFHRNNEGEFGRIAANIGEILGISGPGSIVEPGCDPRPIKADDLAQIVGEHFGGGVNCYPGIPGMGCYPTAFFFSLQDKRRAKGRGHLTMRKVLEELVKHFSFHCKGKTHTAIVILDNWDPKAFADWEDPIRSLSREVHIEIYLVAANEMVRIPI